MLASLETALPGHDSSNALTAEGNAADGMAALAVEARRTDGPTTTAPATAQDGEGPQPGSEEDAEAQSAGADGAEVHAADAALLAACILDGLGKELQLMVWRACHPCIQVLAPAPAFGGPCVPLCQPH